MLFKFLELNGEYFGAERSYTYLLKGLIPIDFIFILFILFYPSASAYSSILDLLVSSCCSLLILIYGYISLRMRHPILISIFAACILIFIFLSYSSVILIDAVISGIKIFTLIQFLHFLLQIVIFRCVYGFSELLVPTWVNPSV